jgi:chromosomal replication initiator protein
MAASSIPRSSPPATGCWRLVRWAIDELVAPRTADGPAFNPLTLVSSGAELMGDIASRAEAAGKRVLRRSGRDLGDEIARAVAADSLERLQERLTTTDLVVVDALEGVGEKDRQAVICHLMDGSVESGTVWCISISRPPQAAGIASGLVTRLSGGLVITLPATAIAAPKRSPRISRIIAATARQFDLSVTALTSPRRSRHVAGARSLAMYLARELTGASYGAIGKACGGRDHTTAMHATRKIASAISRDSNLAADAAAIVARVG